MAMSLRVFSWIRVLERMAIRLKQLQLPRRTFTRWKIGKSVCIAVALPAGFHLVSHFTSRHPYTTLVSPAMANCTEHPPLSEIVARTDEYYDLNKMREGLKYSSQYEHLDEVEVLWRLARLCYKAGKYQTSEQEERESLARQGWSYIERALALGGDRHNSTRRWAGILLSWWSEFEGTKKKIEKSFEIRDHFVAAIECDGSDATSMHLLGQWCYSVVSIPWYQRQVATVLFATPPTSSYEEALSHFEAAEKVDPGFYMVNWLWMGKCHLDLGKTQEAKTWLQRVVKYETTLEEEVEAKKEAETLLGKL